MDAMVFSTRGSENSIDQMPEQADVQSEPDIFSQENEPAETNPYVVAILVLLFLVLIIRSKMSKKATPANTKNSTSEQSNSTAAPNKSTPTKAISSQLSRDDMINARLARFKIGMQYTIH